MIYFNSEKKINELKEKMNKDNICVFMPVLIKRQWGWK